MRTYEIMCVFAPQDEDFKSGLGEVKAKLETLGAQIQSEKDMGVKELAYEMQSHNHAHYLYFTATLTPEKAHALRSECRLIKPLLRMLVLKKDD